MENENENKKFKKLLKVMRLSQIPISIRCENCGAICDFDDENCWNCGCDLYD